LPELHDACSVDDLRPNEPIVVRVAGNDVLIVRFEDEIFALRNICPHENASFLGGHIRPRLTSGSPDEPIQVDRSDPLLYCPWHTWSFSLRNGQCTSDRSKRVLSYEVLVRGERVLIRARRRQQVAEQL
jgi:3-phenylpropionate/trans-cinnamate dioxygenase ferredoxin subunit